MVRESGGWRWPLISLIVLVATVAVNGFANALPLNGQTTGEIINRDPVYFLPAGWVFSIWGLIYLALGLFVAYGLSPAGRRNPRVQRLGPPFLLTCVANCTWLFLWHWERLPLSLVAMGTLLLALIACYAIANQAGSTTPLAERICVLLPFSLYLGWVSVATIANATVALDRAGWDGWGLAPQLWAAIMIAVGGALAARIGIAARQRDTTLVAGIALVVAVAAAVIALIALVRAAASRHGSAGRLSPVGR